MFRAQRFYNECPHCDRWYGIAEDDLPLHYLVHHKLCHPNALYESDNGVTKFKCPWCGVLSEYVQHYAECPLYLAWLVTGDRE